MALNKSTEGGKHIITKRENIYYLTGFMPSSLSILILEDEPFLLVNEMDREAATENSTVEVRTFSRMGDLREVLADTEDLVVEPSMTVGLMKSLGIGSFEVDDVVSELRMIKDRDEIGNIRRALQIAEEALKELEIEGSESSIAAKLEYLMRLEGSEGASFDTVVTSGARSSIPHATPTGEPAGSPLLLDWGAVYKGYHSDTTRTAAWTEREQEILEIVVEAKKEGLRTIKDGVRACEVDRAVRSVMEDYGYLENFIHSTGHGVGLEVHEKPSLAPGDKTVIRKGMVVTVEPGIYLPGEFGVRMEDMVVVGNGAEVINRLPDYNWI